MDFMSSDSGDPTELVDSSDDEDEDDRKVRTTHEAQEKFTESMINLYLDQVPMSAQSLCIAMHWAVEGGLKGFAEQIAMPPGRAGGKYSDRIKKGIANGHSR